MRARCAIVAAIVVLALVGCGKKEPEAVAPNPTPGAQPKSPAAVPGTNGTNPKVLAFPPRSAVGVPYKKAKPTVSAKPPVDEGKKFTGLPSYPGAKFLSSPFDSTKEVKGKTVTIKAEFTTQDQPVAVLDFYKKFLKVDSYSVSGAAAYMSGTTGKGEMVVVASVADKDNKSLTHFQVVVTRKK